MKEVLDQTKAIIDNAEKTIVTLETAVSGVVEQISDVKGDIAKVMGMFPSLPQLPEGYLFGVIPKEGFQFLDPTALFRGAVPAIDNKPANSDEPVVSSSEEPAVVIDPVPVTTEGEVPPAEPVLVTTEGEVPPVEAPTENGTTHHHPPPPPPAEEPKPKRNTLF